ncbi:MAG: sensor domain-containing phosphodiesterase [Sphingomonadales bacterium]|nr:sensor domain-containing phosphodiesterase [Sphingomonadales bacterium]NCQ20709.1 sensor domain-containing phosphodiesterase [Sphingomonadales bacterium]NCT03707.1 sensor domain-containing phosphodiesterase [Sphingomonadales bacterium]
MTLALHDFSPDSIAYEPDSSDRERSRSRRDALARYDILDSASETQFDDLVTLAARIVGTQAAAISLIDDHRQWFKARCGIEPSETPLSVSFCAHAIESDDLFVIRDASSDCRFADNPLVTGPPHVRFYAGMRILAGDGTPIAALCVIDQTPRPDGLTAIEETTLRTLAGQVEALLELRRLLLEREAQVIAQSRLSDRLRYVAEHDDLTGLPRRDLFQRRLIAAMHDAAQNGTRTAMLFVDVDHFKQVNDSLGHDAGDALLCGFGQKLRTLLRHKDTAARLGGDEFGVILTGIDRDEQIADVMKSLSQRLHEPIPHRGQQINCKASVGVAIYPDHATDAEGLMKCADLALAEAKLSRGRVETFSPRLMDEFNHNAQMLSVAREGLDAGRLIAHYQPKIDLNTGALVGFEALVRCQIDDDLTIMPNSFAHAFDDRELAVAISAKMISSVLDDIRTWADQGLAFGHVAINTGAADFRTDSFAEMLLAEINARGLSPSMIELEVTEGVFLGRGAQHVDRALSTLSKAGVRIALDDFGTGYASLTHLKQFRVDVLKIDRSFVSGIDENFDDTTIVRALIGLGKSLGIATVAEGIETAAQAEFARFHGCDIAQGYFFGKAKPAAFVPAVIERFTRDASSPLSLGSDSH